MTLGEGFTPLIHARALGATLGLDRLFIKDESLNPTNSFKARGQSAAITRAQASRRRRRSRCRPPATPATPPPPTAAAAGLACEVFIPKDAKRPFVDECRLYGANVTLVDGLITDAGRMAAERQAARLVRRLDAEGAVPHRRQEDDGATSSPSRSDWRCPTGSSIRPAAAPAWSACGRRSRRSKRIGWIRRPAAAHGVGAGRGLRADRPRVRAGRREGRSPGRTPRPMADGLRVPRAIGDFLILRAVRESGGTARRRQRRSRWSTTCS